MLAVIAINCNRLLINKCHEIINTWQEWLAQILQRGNVMKTYKVWAIEAGNRTEYEVRGVSLMSALQTLKDEAGVNSSDVIAVERVFN